MMNKYSYICKFILEHNNWREILTDKHITLKESGKRAIFNYAIFADFTNPVVQEARNICICHPLIQRRVVCPKALLIDTIWT